MSGITPIENKDAEQAVIAILAEQIRETSEKEHAAWTAYTTSPVPRDELRNRWISVNGAMQAAYQTAVKVCEQIGAGWDAMFNALYADKE